jgi:hypothetical protein
MAEKPVDSGQAPAREAPADPPSRSDEEFRLLCRRYSRMRTRLPG